MTVQIDRNFTGIWLLIGIVFVAGIIAAIVASSYWRLIAAADSILPLAIALSQVKNFFTRWEITETHITQFSPISKEVLAGAKVNMYKTQFALFGRRIRVDTDGEECMVLRNVRNVSEVEAALDNLVASSASRRVT